MFLEIRSPLPYMRIKGSDKSCRKEIHLTRCFLASLNEVLFFSLWDTYGHLLDIQTFSVKCQIVNMSGSVGHEVSVTTTQPRC